MNNTINYKGYTARIEFDPRYGIFIGRILDIPDSIIFDSATVPDLVDDFHGAVDQYLSDRRITRK